MVSPTYPMSRSVLATLIASRPFRLIQRRITKSLPTRTDSFISIGLSIHLVVATLSRQCLPVISHSESRWPVTSTSVVALYFASSLLVRTSSAAATISFIIFGHRATPRRFTATSSTLFVSEIVIQHHPFGSFNRLSSLNFAPCATSRW